jgi:hypothetical protein
MILYNFDNPEETIYDKEIRSSCEMDIGCRTIVFGRYDRRNSPEHAGWQCGARPKVIPIRLRDLS